MKKLFLFCAVFIMCFSVFALDVNENELKRTGSNAINFENYSGPHAVIESADAIRGIGIDLGNIVASNIDSFVEARPEGKYTVIHTVDAEKKDALDADILLLNSTAGVDHIRNLRRIIAGYLEAAYNYPRDDAETIAVFVTIYNAVYRGNLSYFSENYKVSVLNYLSSDKVGLSVNWEEWAGNTQIVIPLVSTLSDSATVETSVITDSSVMEALKKEEDKGTEVREKMAEIKEKESTTASKKANEAQKDAAEHKNAAKGAENREEAKKEREAAEKSGKVATEQQQIADKKRQEARTEKKSVEIDRANVDASSKVDNSHYISGIIGPSENGLYTLITLNGTNGETVVSSPVRQIRNKSIFSVSNVSITADDGSVKTFSTLYMVVCGSNTSKSAIKLCLLDAEKLEIQKESSEFIAEGAVVVEYNGNYYTVISQSGGNSVIACYDKNLTLKTSSSLKVKSSTPVNISSSGILVTDSSGKPRLLDMATLEVKW